MKGVSIDTILAEKNNQTEEDGAPRLSYVRKELLSRQINWSAYLQSRMIDQSEYDFLVAFEEALLNEDAMRTLVIEKAELCVKTLTSILEHIHRDFVVQHILAIIETLLMDNVTCHIFYSPQQTSWFQFLNFLGRPDEVSVALSAHIIALLSFHSSEKMQGTDLQYYLMWLRENLIKFRGPYRSTVTRCLHRMLRVEKYRVEFSRIDGISAMVEGLRSGLDFQSQYELLFGLWVMSFNSEIAEEISRHNVVPLLVDILAGSEKEKVIRMCLATFRNLVEKPHLASAIRTNSIEMVQCGVLRYLELIGHRYTSDEDLTANVSFLSNHLALSVRDLSSFEEYAHELRSGALQWSLVHKSERFWHENAQKLNDNNNEMLVLLVNVLRNSRDPLCICVACHDIGEYVRYYPPGKAVLEALGAKRLVMEKMMSEDPNVRLYALLAVQKIMVHRWDYLSRQVEKSMEEQLGKISLSTQITN